MQASLLSVLTQICKRGWQIWQKKWYNPTLGRSGSKKVIENGETHFNNWEERFPIARGEI